MPVYESTLLEHEHSLLLVHRNALDREIKILLRPKKPILILMYSGSHSCSRRASPLYQFSFLEGRRARSQLTPLGLLTFFARSVPLRKAKLYLPSMIASRSLLDHPHLSASSFLAALMLAGPGAIFRSSRAARSWSRAGTATAVTPPSSRASRSSGWSPLWQPRETLSLLLPSQETYA